LIKAKPLVGVNVREARQNEFPFIVSLLHFNPNNPIPETNHICTGSLITRKDVATAEHCVMSENLSAIQVHYGSVNLRFGIKRFLLWWISYDHWATSIRMTTEFYINDVANIRVGLFSK
jgi:hypothetical protein